MHGLSAWRDPTDFIPATESSRVMRRGARLTITKEPRKTCSEFVRTWRIPLRHAFRRWNGTRIRETLQKPSLSLRRMWKRLCYGFAHMVAHTFGLPTSPAHTCKIHLVNRHRFLLRLSLSSLSSIRDTSSFRVSCEIRRSTSSSRVVMASRLACA